MYFGIRNSEFQVLNSQNGRKVWSIKEPKYSWYSGIPCIKDDTLYIGTSDSHTLYALDAKTGNEFWNAPFDRAIYNAVTMYNDYLIVMGGDENKMLKESGSGRLYIIDKSGSVVNAVSLVGDVFNTPSIYKDVLVFGSRDNAIHSISLSKLILNPKENIEYDNSAIDLGIIEVNNSIGFNINKIYNKGLKAYSFEIDHESNTLSEASISISPSEGTLLAKDSVSVRLKINSDQIDNGKYNLTIKINDVQNSENVIEKEIIFTKEYVTSTNNMQEEGKKLVLYPNPFKDEIHLIRPLTIKNNLVVKLYNMQGKELKSLLINLKDEGDLIRLDLDSSWKSGIYKYTIYSEEVFYARGLLIKE